MKWVRAQNLARHESEWGNSNTSDAVQTQEGLPVVNPNVYPHNKDDKTYVNTNEEKKGQFYKVWEQGGREEWRALEGYK